MFIVTFFSCRNENVPVKIKKIYYPTGEIKEIDKILNDSILIDTSYGYYKNGRIMFMEVFDSLGRLSGTAQYFGDNGNHWGSDNYVKGIKQGESIQYDSLGNLWFTQFYQDGQIAGDYYIYKNKKVIKYKFFDFVHGLATKIEYDSNGNIIKNDRNRIFFDTMQVVTIPGGFNLYKISILQSNPLHTANKLIANYYDKAGKLIDHDSLTTTGIHLIELQKKFKINFYKMVLTDTQYDSTLKKTYTGSYPITFAYEQ